MPGLFSLSDFLLLLPLAQGRSGLLWEPSRPRSRDGADWAGEENGRRG
ncbi:hypothetical protein CAC42_119 [Sphaceloma murrayae]|uniref:Uncharacterized protein n=1 Tax=Sphaceloma murrayae TaxID=2082308 RepID=A0A2K1QML1_9PEZI|nr:hypothetical protein CAC42_119 [Sphaceloma murrayae]